MASITIGSTVKIKRGLCGEGYRFIVSSIIKQLDGKFQIYGNNNSYGPVRASDIVKVS